MFLINNGSDLENWMNVFDNAFMNLFTDGDSKSYVGENYASSSFPPANIYQNENNDLIYEFAVAGYSKDEIALSYKDDYLTISLTPKAKNEKDDVCSKRMYAQKGIRHSYKETSYYVPLSRFDISKLTSVLKEGILTVTIPYNEQAKPKTFNIDIK